MIRTLAATAILIASTAGAFAQAQLTPAQRQEAMALMQTCRPDFNRYCPGVQPGGGRIASCLAANRSKLSPACSDAMMKAADMRAAAKSK